MMDRRTFHKALVTLLATWLSPLRGGADAGSQGLLPVRGPNAGNAEEKDRSIEDKTQPTNAPRAQRSFVLRVHSFKVLSAPVQADAIDTKALLSMLEEGLKALTGAHDARTAWLSVLGDYKKSDRVAIKPNFNNLPQGALRTITSPHLINAVVKQLVELVGVPPANISLYDLCKKIPQDLIRSRIEHPIEYVEPHNSGSLSGKLKLRLHYGAASADTRAEIEMREPIVDENGDRLKCYIPKVLTRAEHLINMPLLTNHIFILNSGALKNHFGTVRFSNFNSYPVALHGPVLNKSVTDINRNHHIRKKTRLVIADGLFGIFARGDGSGEKKWKTFRDDYPRSIFLSKDPVAIDSVMASIVARERMARQLKVLSPEYVRDAAEKGLGVYEFTSGDERFSKIRYQEISI